jgi:hypothetical protein
MDKLKERDPIPAFETLEEIAAFWDAHSTADYDDLTHEVQFEVKLRHPLGQEQSVRLVPELSELIQTLAEIRGVSVETLINVWLTEKVHELS